MKLDNRGLEPPQPMMKTLEALETLKDNHTLVIINDRQPMFLYPELEERGYLHNTTELKDGSYQITIKKDC